MFKVGQFFNYRSKQNFILHSYLPIYSLFGDTLWANNNLVRLCRIVTFQKEDVKNVAKIKYRESTFNTFKELNSLRIRELNELDFFFVMFKSYNNQLPKTKTNFYVSNFQIHNHDTRHADDCHLPRKSSRLGQYSLAYHGPKICNKIETKPRKIKSLHFFN